MSLKESRVSKALDNFKTSTFEEKANPKEVIYILKLSSCFVQRKLNKVVQVCTRTGPVPFP
jgi:hypothetical protein